MHDEIRDFITNDLNKKDMKIENQTSLFKNKILDSLNISELIMFLEDQYSIEVGMSDVNYDNFDSIDNIVGYIQFKRK